MTDAKSSDRALARARNKWWSVGRRRMETRRSFGSGSTASDSPVSVPATPTMEVSTRYRSSADSEKPRAAAAAVKRRFTSGVTQVIKCTPLLMA